MRPEDVEVFENGDVSLEVHTLEDESKIYWVKSGVAAMYFDAERFADLIEMLNAYGVETFILDNDPSEGEPLGVEKESLWPFVVLLLIGFIVFGMIGVWG